jgi:hypothetical protein
MARAAGRSAVTVSIGFLQERAYSGKFAENWMRGLPPSAPRERVRFGLICARARQVQAELVMPELTATISSSLAGEGERRFRYAPLSSGLDIVRKTSGQHDPTGQSARSPIWRARLLPFNISWPSCADGTGRPRLKEVATTFDPLSRIHGH